MGLCTMEGVNPKPVLSIYNNYDDYVRLRNVYQIKRSDIIITIMSAKESFGCEIEAGGIPQFFEDLTSTQLRNLLLDKVGIDISGLLDKQLREEGKMLGVLNKEKEMINSEIKYAREILAKLNNVNVDPEFKKEIE
jgi:hypothetical protein